MRRLDDNELEVRIRNFLGRKSMEFPELSRTKMQHPKKNYNQQK